MDEIHRLLKKYDSSYVRDGLASAESIDAFASTFYKDVAEICCYITLFKNTERNPSGYSLLDAPVLGLLVRAWKLLKEVIRYYDENNGEIVGMFERPLLEAVIIARYLMANDHAVMEDYRRCSYKEELRILREYQPGQPLSETNAGKLLVASVRKKLAFEGLTEDSFKVQKQNEWKLQGKRFRAIFQEVVPDELYPSSYGTMSASIHGSWHDSEHFCLTRNDDGTFLAFPLFRPADLRDVIPLLFFTIPAYRMWLHRIGAEEADFYKVLDMAGMVNGVLFKTYSKLYGA